MARHLFTIISALSLLLCAALLAGWCDSYRHTDSALLMRHPQCIAVIGEGTIYLSTMDVPAGHPPGRAKSGIYRGMAFPWTNSKAVNVSFMQDIQRSVGSRPYGQIEVLAIPVWLLAACCRILPALLTCKMLLTRRMHGIGCCSVCGYDLRASPERCPECGTAKPQAV